MNDRRTALKSFIAAPFIFLSSFPTKPLPIAWRWYQTEQLWQQPVTKEQYKERLKDWDRPERTKQFQDSCRDLERVITLTPVEASVLIQTCIQDRLDGTEASKIARRNRKALMEVLAEKYNFIEAEQKERTCFWILDGQIGIFKKGWMGR